MLISSLLNYYYYHHFLQRAHLLNKMLFVYKSTTFDCKYNVNIFGAHSCAPIAIQFTRSRRHSHCTRVRLHDTTHATSKRMLIAAIHNPDKVKAYGKRNDLVTHTHYRLYNTLHISLPSSRPTER